MHTTVGILTSQSQPSKHSENSTNLYRTKTYVFFSLPAAADYGTDSKLDSVVKKCHKMWPFPCSDTTLVSFINFRKDFAYANCQMYGDLAMTSTLMHALSFSKMKYISNLVCHLFRKNRPPNYIFLFIGLHC